MRIVNSFVTCAFLVLVFCHDRPTCFRFDPVYLNCVCARLLEESGGRPTDAFIGRPAPPPNTKVATLTMECWAMAVMQPWENLWKATAWIRVYHGSQ